MVRLASGMSGGDLLGPIEVCQLRKGTRHWNFANEKISLYTRELPLQFHVRKTQIDWLKQSATVILAHILLT